MKKHEEIRRRLARQEMPATPPDLLPKLKHQIPEHLSFATSRERDTVRGFQSSMWRIAASIVLLAGIGWLGLSTLRSPAPTSFAAEKNAAVTTAFRQRPAEELQTPPPAADAETAENEAPRPQKTDSLRANLAEGRVVAVEENRKEKRRDSLNAVQPSSAVSELGAKDNDERQELKKSKPAETFADRAADEPSGQVASKAEADDKVESGVEAGTVGGVVGGAPQAQARPAAAPAAPAVEMSRAAKAVASPHQASPVPLHCSSMSYPREAREAGTEGVAIIAATIGPDGKVEKTEIVRSLPHGLGKAAEQAVRNCVFQPATLDGQPIRTRFEVPVRFDLEKGVCVLCEEAGKR
jgi:protein TonB